jgi:hypothetical protein
MDLFKRFATDREAELKGTWRDLGEGCELLVARWNNDNFNQTFEGLKEKHAEALNSANAAERERQYAEIVLQVMVDTILLGWKGTEYNGEELEYSKANARKLLEMRDFRELVATMSRQMDAYLIHKQAQAGND